MTGRIGPEPPRGTSARLLPWFEAALCASHPQPDLWFSHEREQRGQARQICRGCPVRAGCLAAALARGEEYGTWGGRDLDTGRNLGRGHDLPAGAADAEAAAPAARLYGRSDGMSYPPEQLGLPLVLENDPTRPARWVAAMVGLPVERVEAAIEAGDLPGTHDGQQWQVPLWAIPAFSRSVA